MKRPHDPIRFRDGRIRIGSVQYGVGSEIADDAEGTVWRLLQLMDGTRAPAEIVETVLRERPELDRESVEDVVDTLLGSGFVEDAGAKPAPGLSPEEVERYSRSENYFAWIDTTPRERRLELQARLKASSVAVIGLGGSGSAVAAALVATGVGALRCVDFDRVELSNLNRQLLFGEDDVGLPKLERAVQRLRRLNRHVRVEGVELRLGSKEDAARCLRGVDFAVLCADVPHPDIQLWTNAAALELGVPWSLCFYAGPMITTGIFVPHQTPCFRCMHETAPLPTRDEAGGEGEALYGVGDENAVIAPTAGLTGNLGALEVVYFLTGLQPQTVGRIFHQNLLVYDHAYYIEPTFVEGCPVCGGPPTRPQELEAAPAGGG